MDKETKYSNIRDVTDDPSNHFKRRWCRCTYESQQQTPTSTKRVQGRGYGMSFPFPFDPWKSKHRTKQLWIAQWEIQEDSSKDPDPERCRPSSSRSTHPKDRQGYWRFGHSFASLKTRNQSPWRQRWTTPMTQNTNRRIVSWCMEVAYRNDMAGGTNIRRLGMSYYIVTTNEASVKIKYILRELQNNTYCIARYDEGSVKGQNESSHGIPQQ